MKKLSQLWKKKGIQKNQLVQKKAENKKTDDTNKKHLAVRF